VYSERLIERAELRRAHVSSELDARHRAEWGQFFTPAPVARFLADLIELPSSGRFVVLDPGAGTGSLAAALVAKAIREDAKCSLVIVGFEADPTLLEPLAATFRDCERAAEQAGISLTTEIQPVDFLHWAAEELSALSLAPRRLFDACLMNPPYRKVNTASADRQALERIGLQITNLYPGFLGATAELLQPGGQLAAITPRSFANGPYFLPFRRFFLSRMALSFVHVYERRGKLFADADVLQENVVFRAVRGEGDGHVVLSRSAGFDDEPMTRVVTTDVVVSAEDPQLFIHIPVDETAIEVAQQILDLPSSLSDLGIEVSTGRVVDFRTRGNLLHEPDPDAAPLIYPSHLQDGRVSWPQLDGRKPNALDINASTVAMLLPAGSYCLVKRFTAKEEPRRVVAATLHPDDVHAEVVAFENHLNVFHREGRGLDPALAAGLASFLNTTTVDSYVRQFSGHTQINATDLRRLRYPDQDTLLKLGETALAAPGTDQGAVDEIAGNHVAGLAPEHAPARAA